MNSEISVNPFHPANRTVLQMTQAHKGFVYPDLIKHLEQRRIALPEDCPASRMNGWFILAYPRGGTLFVAATGAGYAAFRLSQEAQHKALASGALKTLKSRRWHEDENQVPRYGDLVIDPGPDWVLFESCWTLPEDWYRLAYHDA